MCDGTAAGAVARPLQLQHWVHNQLGTLVAVGAYVQQVRMYTISISHNKLMHVRTESWPVCNWQRKASATVRAVAVPLVLLNSVGLSVCQHGLAIQSLSVPPGEMGREA